MDVTMAQAAESNLKLIVDYVTADGSLADIQGEHHVESSNPSIASLLSQDDTTQHHEVIYELHAVAGQATLSGFADADLGDGERMIAWSFDLNVTAEEAETATVSAGELIPKAVVP